MSYRAVRGCHNDASVRISRSAICGLAVVFNDLPMAPLQVCNYAGVEIASSRRFTLAVRPPRMFLAVLKTRSRAWRGNGLNRHVVSALKPQTGGPIGCNHCSRSARLAELDGERWLAPATEGRSSSPCVACWRREGGGNRHPRTVGRDTLRWNGQVGVLY
jgi:hypothetical protein